MSKCSVCRRLKSKDSYWTLLRPKYWARACAKGSSRPTMMASVAATRVLRDGGILAPGFPARSARLDAGEVVSHQRWRFFSDLATSFHLTAHLTARPNLIQCRRV